MGIKRVAVEDVELRNSINSTKDNKGCIPHPQNQKRYNSGNPNAFTGKGFAETSSAPPADKSQEANRRNWKTPIHWDSEGYKKGQINRNPSAPSDCTAKTYTRNNPRAARS